MARPRTDNTDPETGAPKLATPQPPDQLPAAYRSLVSFSKQELDDMNTRADAFLSDPTQLKEYLMRTTLLLIQVNERLAMNPPPGRQGPTVAARAGREFVNLATKLMSLIADKDKDAEA